MADNPELNQWMEEFDQQSELNESNKTELLTKAEEIAAKFDPEHKQVPILWRLAKAAFKASGDAEIAKDKANHKKLLEKSIDYSNKALALNPDDCDANSWAAFACGKLSDHLGTKDRIKNGKQVQLHLEKAIAADPSRYALHFTFGRWCMEVAKLSWMEKKIASTLFEKVPEATYEDAIKHFEECEKLKPDWKALKYWKAKSYIALKKYDEASKALKQASELDAQDAEDQVIEADLKALVKQYPCKN